MITFILKFQLLLILQTLDANCPKGEYGFKCQFRCRCKQDIGCNPITGSCPNGCNPKFYGPGCLLFNPFTYDPHGRLYTGSINRTESGKPCQPWSTSIFVTFFNYTGSQFADKFIPGAVCRNPNTPGQNRTSPWCFTNSYTLKQENCYLSEGECHDGRFGPNCVNECHCRYLEPCDKQTGKCRQCYDGWIGPSCQIKCAASKYGTNCEENCGKCKENLCDHETGKCLNGCNGGWIGDFCNTSYTNTSEKHSTFNWIISSVVVGIFMVIIIVLTIYCWLKRKGSSTTVSDVRPDIYTINDNSANDRAFLNNVQEAETILDGQSVKRVNHHSSSFRLSTSSDDSAHSSDSLTSI